jgi:hypothetical protein
VVFRFLPTYLLKGGYQHFRETCVLHIQTWRWRHYVPPKRWYSPRCPHSQNPEDHYLYVSLVFMIKHLTLYVLLECLRGEHPYWSPVIKNYVHGRIKGFILPEILVRKNDRKHNRAVPVFVANRRYDLCSWQKRWHEEVNFTASIFLTDRLLV